MTGLDCLKEEMKNRGMTKAQCDSKIVAVVLDILSNAGTNHTAEYQAKADLDAVYRAIRYAKWELENVKQELENVERACEYERKKILEWRDGIEKDVNELLSSLEKCETPEGRDRLKAAQMFVNSVTVDTKYDNTAFIIGLSAILSGGKIAPIDELRKINKKIPAPNGILTDEYERRL